MATKAARFLLAKAFVIFLALLFGVLCLISCGPQDSEQTVIATSITPTTKITLQNTPPSDMGHDWLINSLCQAPCWHNIVPGQTNANTAFSILQKDMQISNLRFETQNGYDEINWGWGSDLETTGRAFFDTANGNVIYAIIPGSQRSYALRDVIRVYGDPDSIFATAAFTGKGSSSPLKYTLYYLFSKFGLEVSIPPTYPKPTLNPGMVVGDPLFFAHDTRGIDASFLSEATPWKGFLSFDAYCQSADSSCQNVPVTPDTGKTYIQGGLASPLYPYAENVQSTISDDQRRKTLTFNTTDTRDTVFAYYQNALPQEGWSTVAIESDLLEFASPATYAQSFTLVIRTAKTDDGKTKVVLSQTLAGTDKWPR